MTVSPEELDMLEETDPIEAFNLMIRSCALLSKTTEGSSNTSISNPSETSKENLLMEIRTKVLEVDLFQAIKQDTGVILEIKGLLRKLSKTSFGSKFQELSNKLESLMDDIDMSFQQRKIEQSKLEDQTKLHDQLMVEITTFQQNIVNFRQEIPDAKQKVEEIDSAIAKHEEEIKTLRMQRANVLERESIMQKEAKLAIRKVKESQAFEREMAARVENGKVLDEMLAKSKGKLNKLKSEFVI